MGRKYSDDWFERELAQLKAGLEQLESQIDPAVRNAARAVPVAPRKKRATRPRRTTGGTDSPRDAAPASTEEAPAQPNAPVAAQPARVESSAAALPTGTDLAAPKEFGLLPKTSDLERGEESEEAYRARLTQLLRYAHQVLHTSGVIAAVWREWRAFERAGQEKLRILNQRPAEDPLTA